MTASSVAARLRRTISDPRFVVAAAATLAFIGAKTSLAANGTGLALFVVFAGLMAASQVGVRVMLLTALGFFAAGTVLSILTSSPAPITGTSLPACALLVVALAASSRIGSIGVNVGRWVGAAVRGLSLERAQGIAILLTLAMAGASIAALASNQSDSFAFAIGHARRDAVPWLGEVNILQAVAIDTIVGALSTYLVARRLGMSSAAGVLCATLWTLLGSRFASQTFRFEPTSFVPLQLWLLCAANSVAIRVVLVAAFGAAAALIAPQFLVPSALTVLAFTMLAPLERRDAWLLRGAGLLTPIGVLVVSHWASVDPLFPEGTAYGGALDLSLRLAGSDGALPTSLFVPSATSGVLFGLLRSWNIATGRFGDVAALSVGPGLATVLLAVAALVVHRRKTENVRALNGSLAVIGISALCMLPSHLGGTPLPTLQLCLDMFVPTMMRASLSALVIGSVAVLLAGSFWDRIPQMGRASGIAILSCFVALQMVETWPNSDLSARLGGSDLARALLWAYVGRDSSRTQLIVVASPDEPFGIRDALIAARYTPNIGITYVSRSSARTIADVIDVSALRARHVSTIVVDWEGLTRFIPPEFEARTALPPSVPARPARPLIQPLNVPGLQLQQMFGPVVAYSTTIGDRVVSP